MSASPDRARPGPKPQFDRRRLVAAAVAIVDSDGFSALSLRSVARHLGVTPMAMYSYVPSAEELVQLVVDELLVQQSQGVEWPERWQDVLRTFAAQLNELVSRHPAMVQAYAGGLIRTPQALRVAEQVVGALCRDGLTPDGAATAYASVHSLVLGQALLYAGRSDQPSPAVTELGDFPALQAAVACHGTLARLPLDPQLDALIAGLAQVARDVSRANG